MTRSTMDLHNLANLYFKDDAKTLVIFMTPVADLDGQSPLAAILDGKSEKVRELFETELELNDIKIPENKDRDWDGE